MIRAQQLSMAVGLVFITVVADTNGIVRHIDPVMTHTLGAPISTDSPTPTKVEVVSSPHSPVSIFGPAQPVAACFAPGTPPDVIAAFEQAMRGADGLRYNLTGRWPGTIGTPIGLSWSLVPDGLSIPPTLPGEPAGNSELFARMDSLFASSGGRAVWIAEIEQAFERWSVLTGVGYYRVTSGGNDWDDGAPWDALGQGGARGDIRVSMKTIDGASNVLAYNYYPQGGGVGGNMVLDRAEDWARPANDFRYFRNTVMHEAGHGLGLLHVCPVIGEKLMEPILSEFFDGPQHDDLRGVHHLYGDRAEENDSVNEVIDLGVLTIGTPIEPATVPPPAIANGSRISIDGDGDQDYFRFSLASSAVVTVKVTPIGNNYASYVQDATCNNNTFNTNSLTIANLNVQLIGSDASSVIATAAGQPAGSVESIQNASLPAAGSYYVRVYEGDSPSQTQLYALSLSSDSACTSPSAPTGVVATEPPDGLWYCDRVLVFWQPVSGATSYQVWRSTVSNVGTAEQIGTTSDSWFEDYDVSIGNTYYYWVKACNACGCSDLAGGDLGALGTPPDPPAGMVASTTYCDRIEVYWNPVQNAIDYCAYRNTVDNPETAEEVGCVPVSPFRDYTVEPGVTFYYWIRTRASCGASGLSAPSASGHAGGLPAPTGVSASDGLFPGCQSMTISWNAVPGANLYGIYWNTVNDPVSAQFLGYGTSGFATSIPPNATWVWFWVVACNSSCCGPLSQPDRGYRNGAPPPDTVTATDATYCDRVRVAWSAVPAGSPVTYDVLRDSQVIATGCAASPYDDFTASPGILYSYSVRAGNSCNPINEAMWSPPDTGYRTVLIVGQPTDATVCVGQSHQFCVTALGPDLAYQWQFNGTDIFGAIGPCCWATVGGEYQCVVSTFCGSIISNAATLSVSIAACDTNCDGSINGFDVDPFVGLLSGNGEPCSPCAGDVNGDGSVNGFDIDGLVGALTSGGC